MSFLPLAVIEAAVASWENGISVIADSGAQNVHIFAAAAVNGYYMLFSHKSHGSNMTWQPEDS